MKIGRILGLIFICIIFSLFGSSVYARRQGPAIYQAFITDLAQNMPDAYSNYISNGACYIIDVSEDTDMWDSTQDYFTGTNFRGRWTSNLSYKNKNSSSYPYSVYICYWTKKGSAPVVRNQTYSDCSKRITFWDKNNAPSSQRNFYFMSVMDGTGSITHLATPKNRYTVYCQDVYIDGTTDFVWADENVCWDEGNVFKSSTKATSISNVQFDFHGNWDSYELYEYLLYYLSNNYNLYANGWAEGPNPTCMIFDNLRGNIKANRLNNSFLPDTANANNGIDYLCVFYPDRFCCYYDEENHDYYFNFFSLNLPFYYITITKSTQAINFYYMDLAYNNTTPVAQIHYEYPESLIFTNKNIIAKSDSSNFILDGTSFTYWRTTSYEHNANPSITPVNPDNQGSYGNGSITVDTSTIEDKQDSIIDKITGFFSGFVDKVKIAITSVFDFVGDTILSLWNNVKNQILSKIPVYWITDILDWIQNIYQNAILRSKNLDFIYHFTFLGKNIEFDPFLLYKNNRVYVDKFISLGLIMGLIFFNIRQIFVILKGGKQG